MGSMDSVAKAFAALAPTTAKKKKKPEPAPVVSADAPVPPAPATPGASGVRRGIGSAVATGRYYSGV